MQGLFYIHQTPILQVTHPVWSLQRRVAWGPVRRQDWSARWEERRRWCYCSSPDPGAERGRKAASRPAAFHDLCQNTHTDRVRETQPVAPESSRVTMTSDCSQRGPGFVWSNTELGFDSVPTQRKSLTSQTWRVLNESSRQGKLPPPTIGRLGCTAGYTRTQTPSDSAAVDTVGATT